MTNPSDLGDFLSHDLSFGVLWGFRNQPMLFLCLLHITWWDRVQHPSDAEQESSTLLEASHLHATMNINTEAGEFAILPSVPKKQPSNIEAQIYAPSHIKSIQ